ncbi:MAG: tetratricopeptide repeat protein [Caldilineaceae bacterium]|nr:tetratricopeptide repeat protein [Caldilineaceae bacterium]
MATLSISLLGTFQVHVDGKPINDFRTSKISALLAYLAVESRIAHARQALAALLWPDDDERSASRSLRQAIYVLRYALHDNDPAPAQPPFLLVTRQELQLNPAAKWSVDVVDFLAALRQGRLEAAVDLYQGELLSGFSCHSWAFEEWITFKREQLHRAVLDALAQMTNLSLQRGDLNRARAYTERELRLEPWREEAHRTLIQFLAAAGDRGAALAQFETCRQILESEFGAEPSAETIAVYEQIRDGSAQEGVAVRHNLPAESTTFVGRPDELARIVTKLTEPACRLLTIAGPGGIGKTRIAIQAGKALMANQVGRRRFSDGIYMVHLAGIDAEGLLIHAIADAVALDVYNNRDPKAQLLNYLRGKSMLLILDNFEYLIEAAPLLSELLDAAPALKLIVTSRQALNLREEWFFSIGGLTYPGDGSAETDLLAYSAIELFTQRAQQARPAFVLASEQEHVIEICRLVAGMPLAIELAAAWARSMSCAEIAHQLAQDIDLLTSHLRNVPDRHVSLRCSMEYSWRLLTEVEQLVLRRLAVFRSGLDLAAGITVTGATLSTLTGLVEKSLVYLENAGRYQLHELLRQFALEKLNGEPTDATNTLDRHSAYYLSLVARQAEALHSARQKDALEEIMRELDNARAAWEWATTRRQQERIAPALDPLCEVLDWLGRYSEGVRACEGLLATLPSADAAEEPAPASPERTNELLLAARAHSWLNAFLNATGATDAAQQHGRLALSILDRIEPVDARRARAFALFQLGNLAWQSETAAARPYYDEAQALYEELGLHWERAAVFGALGKMEHALGNFAASMRQYRASLDLFRKLGDHRQASVVLSDLAGVLRYADQIGEALQISQDAVEIARRLGNRALLAQSLAGLGFSLHMVGDFEEALAALSESLALAQDLGSIDHLITALIHLSVLTADLGRYDEARAHAERALMLSGPAHRAYVGGMSLFQLSNIALATGNYKEAKRLAEEGAAIFDDSQPRTEHSYLLISWAMAARKLDDIAAARAAVVRVLERAIQHRGGLVLLTVVPFAALLLADAGQRAFAVACWQDFKRLVSAAERRQLLMDMVGNELVAIEQELAEPLPSQRASQDLLSIAGRLLAAMRASGWRTSNATAAV